MTNHPNGGVPALIEKSAPKFALSLPKGANVDRFVRIAQSAALNNDIAGCSPRSIMSSIDAAMRDGLVLDGREAALVSFSSKGEKQAQYMPMVGGLKKKMLAAEGTKSLSVGIIYQGEVDADRFAYYIDETGEHFRHDPLLWGDRGEAIGAYAVLTMTNGGMFVSVMRRDEIEQRKAVSRAASSPYGPWAKWPLEMWKKTVLRSLAKLAPSGEAVASILEAEDHGDAFHVVDEPAPAPAPEPDGKTRTAAAIKRGRAKPAPEPEPDPEPEYDDADIVPDYDDDEIPA